MDAIKGKSIAVRIWHSDQSMQKIEKELQNAKCIPEQWQEASAAGNGHERIAVVSKDRLPFFQAGATESYSFPKRSKPIC